MKLLRNCALLAGLALVPALVSAWIQVPQETWRPRPESVEMNLAQATALAGAVLWVDARPASEFQASHVPGALSLNEGEWERGLPGFLAAWRPGTQVVVYCDSPSCGASDSVRARLARELGISKVFVLTGGWNEWQRAHPR
jgi:rhodanese-related sulfurtransferase